MNIPQHCLDILAELPKQNIKVSMHHKNPTRKAFLKDKDAVILLMQQGWLLIQHENGAIWLAKETNESLPFAIDWKAKADLLNSGAIKLKETKNQKATFVITELGEKTCENWKKHNQPSHAMLNWIFNFNVFFFVV